MLFVPIQSVREMSSLHFPHRLRDQRFEPINELARLSVVIFTMAKESRGTILSLGLDGWLRIIDELPHLRDCLRCCHRILTIDLLAGIGRLDDQPSISFSSRI